MYFYGINRQLINHYSCRIASRCDVRALARETRTKRFVKPCILSDDNELSLVRSRLRNPGDILRTYHIINATCRDVCNCTLFK